MESQCVTTLRESHSPSWLLLWLIVDWSTKHFIMPLPCPLSVAALTFLFQLPHWLWWHLWHGQQHHLHWCFIEQRPCDWHFRTNRTCALLSKTRTPPIASSYTSSYCFCAPTQPSHVAPSGTTTMYLCWGYDSATQDTDMLYVPPFCFSRSGRAIGPAIRLTLFSCCLLLQASPDN